MEICLHGNFGLRKLENWWQVHPRQQVELKGSIVPFSRKPAGGSRGKTRWYMISNENPLRMGRQQFVDMLLECF